MVWRARWIPTSRPRRTDELSGGAEYEVLTDARLGLSLNRRWINHWIEDMGPVVGLNGFAGNPGLRPGLAASPRSSGPTRPPRCSWPRPSRNSWLAQASYTLASLKGNYAGLFAPEDGYLGPNGTADFDSPNVSNNRYGALKGDVRHTFKLLGAKDWQIARGHGLGTGISFRARSGAPTSYLGADPFTYPTESYLAARGTGPRLPWLYTADLQLAYRVAAVMASACRSPLTCSIC